ncbi:F0F1 ATP synthase subunit delta [Blattabacterium cuenoti]|uniref:F0F1 ATP synthase subunit delta n=1 Tax=Blattabacterium cuenoti TaxID=1653831 RepID=UPI001EE9DCFF|nr:F0F1 ATP synthase subunit delta [Blattabacterium cuenoti]
MIFYKKIIEHYAMILFKENEKRKDFKYKTIKNIYNLLCKNYYLMELLYNPLLNNNIKIQIIKEIFFDIFLFNFMKILILKNRFFLLKRILLEYINIYDKKIKNIIKCIIITAVPISEDLQKMISKKIIPNQEKFHIINRIDNSIIGGFIFMTEYKEWNFSIKKNLILLKKK